MKTTIDIADDLLKRSQQLAKRKGSTLRAVLEEGLRLVLKDHRTRGSRPFRLPTFGKDGLNAEFRDADWEKIRSTIYGDATHKRS
ncbi:MAG: type II toxin-antitoxin system VapB family antitoxin [Pseudomonadota bacterium]|nr:type II toxin-antitoxin system VapB family antitoxin [Pseudomonadota bacterium]